MGITPKIKIEIRTLSQLTYEFDVTRDDIELIREAMMIKGYPNSIALGDYIFSITAIESMRIIHHAK